jgi:hypothetical protein
MKNVQKQYYRGKTPDKNATKRNKNKLWKLSRIKKKN